MSVLYCDLHGRNRGLDRLLDALLRQGGNASQGRYA